MTDNQLNQYPGQVTIADLFRELGSINTNVTKALTKLEVIDSRNARADATHTDHENRIREAERLITEFRSAANVTKAWAVGVGGIAGVITGIISDIVNHIH